MRRAHSAGRRRARIGISAGCSATSSRASREPREPRDRQRGLPRKPNVWVAEMGERKQHATQARPADNVGPVAQGSPNGAAGAAVARPTRGSSLTRAATVRLGGRLVKIAASVVAFGLASRALGVHELGVYVVVFAYIQLFNTV